MSHESLCEHMVESNKEYARRVASIQKERHGSVEAAVTIVPSFDMVDIRFQIN